MPPSRRSRTIYVTRTDRSGSEGVVDGVHFSVIRAAKYFATFVVSSLMIVIASPLLFWLGRASSPRGELVVDEDLLADDPGVDVDSDDAHRAP